MARCKVVCPRDGEVIVDLRSMVIDDDQASYRFTCSGACASPVEKPLDDEVRDLLRRVGVPTVEELVSSFAAVLDDDRNIVRALLS